MANTNAIDLSKNPQENDDTISFTVETDPQINVDDVLGIIKDVRVKLCSQQSLHECIELIRKNTDDEDCIDDAVFDALNSKFYECHEDIWTSMELLSVELRNE